MKKFIKCLMVLVLTLSFYGCKNDVYNASITEVFYTDDDPDVVPLSGLTRVSNIYNNVHYTLVVDFNQPNMDSVKLIMQYNSGDEESVYNMTPQYTSQYNWWNDVCWTFDSNVDNFELTCYLEDANGNRSNPYTLFINLRK